MTAGRRYGHGIGRGARRWLGAAVALGLLHGAAPPAAATVAEAAANPVRILVPADGARVTGKRLHVRVRASGPRFRAVVNGRDVTRRFRSRGGGVRTATLVRGRHLRRGRAALSVTSGRPFGSGFRDASVTFRVLRRDDERLRISRRPPAAGAPLDLRVRSSHAVAASRVWVNGRRHREARPEHPDGKGVAVGLAAHHGLRFGPNRVRTEVEHEDGTLSRVTRTFRIRRRAAIADAGPDRAGHVGGTVALDASGSLAPRRGDRLAYRWRLVDAPQGSGVHVDTTEARAQIAPDVPGRYRLRVEVTRGGTAAAAQAQAPVSVDERWLTVAPTNDPMGLPIQTIADDGGIRLGPQHFPKQGNWVQVVVLQSATLAPRLVQAVDVARPDDLAAALASADDNDLVILSGQGNNHSPQAGGFNAANTKALDDAFKALGGTTATRGALKDGAVNLDAGTWSLIGRKGLAPGQAWQNYNRQQGAIAGELDGTDGQSGSLNGYLQRLVSTGGYQFVSPEYTTLDTKGPGATPWRNVIRVGGASYPSGELTGRGRSAGIQMLVLDGSDLHLKTNETFVTRAASGALISDSVGFFNYRLNYVLGESYQYNDLDRYRPPIVVVQTFGNEGYTGQSMGNHPSWVADSVPGWTPKKYKKNIWQFYNWCGGSEATKRLDNNPCAPYPHNPTGLGTTQTVTGAVGRMAGMPARTAIANMGRGQAAEAIAIFGSAHGEDDDQTTVEVGERGRHLVATLRRTRQSQWRATAPYTSEVNASKFWELAFQPHTPWPLSGPPGSSLAEANRYIASRLFVAGGFTDVRDAYVGLLENDWNSLRATLDAEIAYPTGTTAFTAKEFADLRAQLAMEFSRLAQVQKMFDNYKRVFSVVGQEEAMLQMDEIGNTIKSLALKDNAKFLVETAELNEKPIVGDVLYFVGDLFDVFPGGEVAGGPIGLFASAWDLFSELADSNKKRPPTPRPFDEPQRIIDRADQLGADLADRYATMGDTFDHLLRVYASDWGKLQQAYAYSLGPWALSDSAPLTQSLALGIQTAFYQALMPVAYDQFFVSPVYTRTGNTRPKDVTKPGPSDYHCDEGPNPFAKAPASALHYVRWEASDGASENQANRGRNHAIGRALKSQADPLTTQESSTTHGFGSGLADYADTKRAGSDPPASLTDPLFAAPSAGGSPTRPGGLGMSKDEFFGMDTWTAPRLQCGDSTDRNYNP